MTHPCRALFPALIQPPTSGVAFFDNAGGSQLPQCVIDAATRYLTFSYANTGGAYAPSRDAAATIKLAHEIVKLFLNAAPALHAPREQTAGEVILGASSTALCHLVANAYADARDAGWPHAKARASRTEIIVAAAGHEANIGPWARLAARGYTIRFWPTEQTTQGFRPSLGTLRTLLNERTQLVAFPHVSNILGEVWDPRPAIELAKAAGARTMVDGVAYAPHAAPDVRALACDWYVYSAYKVFGPHMGALFGTHEALGELEGPNHFFIPRDEIPRKWEVGGASHEGCAMIAALWTFACQVTGEDPASTPRRDTIASAMAQMARAERGLLKPLIEGLAAHPRLRVIGSTASDESRVATIGFVHESRPARDIATLANEQNLGLRWGHFYSKRLVDELAPQYRLNPDDGVVRVSLLGYNSRDEIDRLLEFLASAC